ncbi:hypothetical protein GJAV_G00094130 [Gymnothorax javanicus]|nr:hypothetical protein GJAV_G00094130 [Gymnothorax javanicus]
MNVHERAAGPACKQGAGDQHRERVPEQKSPFGRTGGAVRLDLQGSTDTQRILLYFYNTELLNTYGEYKTRTEFDKGNFSPLLKNLELTDSGIYTANITDYDGKEKYFVTYRLTVQEAPPIPQVGVALLSSAGGVCNVSVNCSAEDTWASYTCDQIHCTQVENKTSPTGVMLIAMATDGTIHCSSSNQISTETQSKSTKDICKFVCG